MVPIKFQSGLPERERQLARDCIESVLRAVDPSRATAAHLKHLPIDQPAHILAFGKASIAMTRGAIEQLRDRFARATVLAPEPMALDAQFKSKLVATYPCDHPLPTQRNIDATRELLDHARSIPDDHRALVLISGGGSAMLCAPRPRVTLDEIRRQTNDMLRKGAAIGEINAARAQLETLKDGGLAHEIRHVRERFVLLLSDVIGDDPAVIASGPMHDAHPPSTPHMIIAGNNTALDALGAWCARSEIACTNITRGITGEAAEAGRSLAQALIDNAPGTPAAVALGGEPTVNTGDSDGIGGPALELGLAAAHALADADFDWTVITLTTDGIDGPGEAAGCVLTASMLSNPAKRDELARALKDHDTRTMCDTLGATITTGPTGTNVNDVAIAIRWPDSAPASSNT